MEIISVVTRIWRLKRNDYVRDFIETREDEELLITVVVTWLYLKNFKREFYCIWTIA